MPPIQYRIASNIRKHRQVKSGIRLLLRRHFLFGDKIKYSVIEGALVFHLRDISATKQGFLPSLPSHPVSRKNKVVNLRNRKSRIIFPYSAHNRPTDIYIQKKSGNLIPISDCRT